MKSQLRPALFLISLLWLTVPTRGASLGVDFDSGAPPALQGDRPKECTITYLMEDLSTSDTYAARMRISPTPDALASGGRLPCPTFVSERINQRALDFCRERVVNPKDCVFDDMGRGFAHDPRRGETSAGGSRCASDLSSEIGIACWNNGTFDICNVACGLNVQAAQVAALNRCQVKHEKKCTIIGSVPVLAP